MSGIKEARNKRHRERTVHDRCKEKRKKTICQQGGKDMKRGYRMAIRKIEVNGN